MHPPSFHHYILVDIPDFNKISIQKNVAYSILPKKKPFDSPDPSPELGFSCRGRLLRGQDLDATFDGFLRGKKSRKKQPWSPENAEVTNGKETALAPRKLNRMQGM